MGKIILIGGNIEKGSVFSKKEPMPAGLKTIHPQILERLVSEMAGSKSKIEIITSASSTPEAGAEYKSSLKELGCKNVGLMHFKNPKQADEKKMMDRLEPV